MFGSTFEAAKQKSQSGPERTEKRGSHPKAAPQLPDSFFLVLPSTNVVSSIPDAGTKRFQATLIQEAHQVNNISDVYDPVAVNVCSVSRTGNRSPNGRTVFEQIVDAIDDVTNINHAIFVDIPADGRELRT
ncbi:MAG: hypothetical protein WBD64_05835, partial [Candidatus Zixiibacteriota bacterium]